MKFNPLKKALSLVVGVSCIVAVQSCNDESANNSTTTDTSGTTVPTPTTQGPMRQIQPVELILQPGKHPEQKEPVKLLRKWKPILLMLLRK